MSIKSIARNLVMMAIYPKPLISLAYLPRFVRHWIRFNRLDPDKSLHLADIYPSLGDLVTATPFDPHYPKNRS